VEQKKAGRVSRQACKTHANIARSLVAAVACAAVLFGSDASRAGAPAPNDVSDIVAANTAAAVAITARDGAAEVQLSGVLIDPAGIVLTVAHGLEGVTRVDVYLKNGTERPGKLVVRDERTDVALIQIEDARSLPYAVLGDATQLEAGDPLVLIGAPLGLRWSVNQGIVSSTERTYGGQRLIQTDADINPGSSGAPVFDKHGLLVALAKGRIPVTDTDQPAEGLNFLVPINAGFPMLDRHGISSHSRRLAKRGLHTSNPGERIKLLESAVRADATNAEAYFYLGVAYGDTGNRAKQTIAFEKFVQLRPNSFQAHRNLALSYLAADKREEALEHLLKAAELRPDSARVHNDLGETYRRMNMYPKARKEFERALQLDPSLSEAHFNLGLLSATAFGDAVGAAKHFQQYMGLGPKAKDVEEVRRWLKERDIENLSPQMKGR